MTVFPGKTLIAVTAIKEGEKPVCARELPRLYCAVA